MNVEIGTETAQFPEKEYINRIFVAVQDILMSHQFWGTGNFFLLNSSKITRMVLAVGFIYLEDRAV
jgi:hypothetical protein